MTSTWADDVFMGHEFSAEVLEAGPDTDTPPAGTACHVDPGAAVRARARTDRLQQHTLGGYAERMLLVGAAVAHAFPTGSTRGTPR